MALMTKKEIEEELLENLKLETPGTGMVLKNPTVEELRPLLREENFSYGGIAIEFTSGSNNRFNVNFHKVIGRKENAAHIILMKRVVKTPHSQEDYEDLKHVAEVVAKEVGARVDARPSLPGGMFTHDDIYFIRGFLEFSHMPTLLKIVDDIEKLRKHFRDVKITAATFQGITEEILEKNARVAGGMLDWFDHYIETISTGQIQQDGYRFYVDVMFNEFYPLDSDSIPTKWELKLFECSKTDSNDELRLVCELKEAYRQVMVEMGLLEPVSEPEEAEKVGEEREIQEPVSKPTSELTHRDRDSGRDIPVGRWLSEEDEDERTVYFEPIHPIPLKDSRVGAWLEKQIAEYGRGEISEEGEVTVYVPTGIRYGRLLGQVSWAYFTLLRENNLL